LGFTDPQHDVTTATIVAHKTSNSKTPKLQTPKLSTTEHEHTELNWNMSTELKSN